MELEEPVSGEKLDLAAPEATGSLSTPRPAPASASPKIRAKAPLAKKAAKKAAQIPPKALDTVDAAGGKEQARPLVDGAAACSASQPLQPVSEAGEMPIPSCPPDGAREEVSQPQLPVMEPAEPSSLPPPPSLLPPESPSEEPAAKRAKPTTPEAAVPSPESPELEMTPEMREIISEAIAQGIAAGLKQHRLLPSAASDNALRQGQAPPPSMSIPESLGKDVPLSGDNAQGIAAGLQQHRPSTSAAFDNALRQGQAPPSSMSIPESLGKDVPLSGDKGGTPDAYGVTRLFKPALFKTLLQNAKATAGIGADPAASDPGLSDPNNLLFSKPTTNEEIPCPKSFLDVVQQQWAVLGAAPKLTENEKQFYNVGPIIRGALKPPTIDEPVASYACSTILSNNLDDALNPEEKRTEMALILAHKSAAWAVRSAMAASFFTRTSLLWLKQMQARFPVTDLQTHKDLNNLIAAAEFSADATLNSVRFASRAIGNSLTARRLLWLRPWQSNIKFKWKLASTHFKGDKLFGEALEPILVETKDKKKVLPSMSKQAGQKSLPNIRKRKADTGQPQRAYFQQHGGQSSKRKQVQSKQPFRGNGSRSFLLSSRSLQTQASRGPAVTGDCSPKGFEEVESVFPLIKTQQASCIQEIQNAVHTREHPDGRLPDVNRSHGIISTHPYVANSPTISMDMQSEPALPVQSSHEDSSDALVSSRDYPYSRPILSGRHVDQIVLSSLCHRGPTDHDPGPSGSFRESEIHSQQLQEPLVSYRQDAPPSSISRRDNMHSLPVPEPLGQHQGSSKPNLIVPNIASRPRLTIVKQDGVLRLLCSRGKSAYQDLTMVPPAYPEIRQEQFNYQRPSPNRGPAVVDVTNDNQGMPIPGTEPSYYSYGRQYARLESPDRDPDGRRPVDTRGMTNQHQLATDASRPYSPPMDPDDHLRPPRTYPSRECNRQSPYDPPREHPLEDIDYRRQDPIRSPPVVDVTKHNQRMGIQETELSHHRSGGRFSRPESPDRDPDARRPMDRSRTTNQFQPVRAQIRPRSPQKDPDHHRWTPHTDSSRKRKK